MAHFWNKTGDDRFAPGGHWHHREASLFGTNWRFSGHRDLASTKEALFRARDWVDVADFLEGGSGSGTSPSAKDPYDVLASSLAELRASLNGQILRSSPIAEQLVDIWAVAKQIHPDAARPAEALLCAIGGCDLVTAGQVRAACDQIEAVLRVPTRPARDHTGVPFCETPGTNRAALPLSGHSR